MDSFKVIYHLLVITALALCAVGLFEKTELQNSGCYFEKNNSTRLKLHCNQQTSVPKCSQFGLKCLFVSYLDLQSNAIVKLKPGSFQGYLNLKVLDLHGNPIEVCETGAFNGLNKLEVLYMDNLHPRNAFTSFQPQIFQPLNSLKHLYLHSNINLDSMLKKRLCDFSNNVDTISLVQAKTYKNGEPIKLDKQRTRCLRKINVKTLNMEGNKIMEITKSALENLKGVHHLSLKKNYILPTPSDYLIGALHKVRYLDISCQNSHQCAPRYPWMEWLKDQPKEYLISTPEPQINPKVVQMMEKTLYIDFLPNLHTLKMHDLTLLVRFNITPYNIYWRNSIVNLDVSYLRALYYIPDVLLGYSCLKYLNMRGNNLIRLSPYTFSQMPSLEVLMLGSSKLSIDVFSTKQAVHLFKNNTSLKFLDLSDLGLSNISPKLLEPLLRLETIILSKNRLQQAEHLFKTLFVVKNIDLSYNKLNRFPANALRQLQQNYPKNSSETSPTLQLTGNTFVCMCLSLDWMEKLQTTNVNVNMTGVQCILANTSSVSIQKAYHILQYECNKTVTTPLIFLCGIYPLILLAFVIGSWLFCVYRWNFIYYYFKAKEILNFQRSKKQKFYFDAFVCHASEDENLMRDNILKLEAVQKPYKFCVHYRNFMPGREILDNIFAAMDNSKHVILLVTKHFLKSGWCTTESSIALMRQCGQSQKSVLVVLFPNGKKKLKKRSSQDRYQSLKLIIDRVTYLEGPVTKDDQEEFWQKLKQALGEPIKRDNDGKTEDEYYHISRDLVI